jgi:hypothetical protein
MLKKIPAIEFCLKELVVDEADIARKGKRIASLYGRLNDPGITAIIDALTEARKKYFKKEKKG